MRRQYGMAGERRRKLLLGGHIERNGERYGEQCAEPIHGVPPMIDPRGQQGDDLAGRIDRRLLRVRERPPGGHRAAAKRDELAPFQLIELHPLPLTRVAA